MSRARAAIISGLRSIPGLTVGEIAECDIDLSGITVSELCRGAAFNAKAAVKNAVVSAPTPVSTGLKIQRGLFDEYVRAILSGSELPLGSEVIASVYSDTHDATPTPDQIRKSLARSVKAKLVKRTGRARGTRYTLTAKGTRGVA